MSDSDGRSGRSPLHDLGELRLRNSRHGDEHVIALAGDFELATAATVEDALERAAAGDATTIVLDLSGVAFMDSSGLQTVFAAHQALGGRLELVPGPRNVQRVFEICGFGGLLPFVERPAPRPVPAIDAILSAQIARSAVARRSSQAALASAVRGLRSKDRRRHLRAVR